MKILLDAVALYIWQTGNAKILAATRAASLVLIFHAIMAVVYAVEALEMAG